LVCSAAFGLQLGAADLAQASLAMMLLGLEFGCLALAVGAVTGRRAYALSVAAVAAVATYLLYVAGELVDAVQPWQPLSPFHQALTGGPLGSGWQTEYLWMRRCPGGDARDSAVRPPRRRRRPLISRRST
jgi:ABC-2 type transport system permease protein